MAPTTLEGQVTTTSPTGRIMMESGYPINICELLSVLRAPAYIERVALYDQSHINRAKKAVKKALLWQIEGNGFSLVEVLSTCPVGWKMTPSEARRFVEEEMERTFPLGVCKEVKRKG